MRLKVIYQVGGSDIYTFVSQGFYATTIGDDLYLQPDKARELVLDTILKFKTQDNGTGTGVRFGSHYCINHGINGDFLEFVLTNDLAHKRAFRQEAKEVASLLLHMVEEVLSSYLWVDSEGNPVDHN